MEVTPYRKESKGDLVIPGQLFLCANDQHRMIIYLFHGLIILIASVCG